MSILESWDCETLMFHYNDRTASCNSVTWASSNRCNATTLATAFALEGVKSFKFLCSQMKAPRFRARALGSERSGRLWVRGAFFLRKAWSWYGQMQVWPHSPNQSWDAKKGPNVRCRCPRRIGWSLKTAITSFKLLLTKPTSSNYTLQLLVTTSQLSSESDPLGAFILREDCANHARLSATKLPDNALSNRKAMNDTSCWIN